MVVYRYQFADVLTDQDIAALELADVRFDRRIIQAGSFEARIPVPNSRVARLVRRVIPTQAGEIHTGPGRTICHVYRDQELWGSYIIWTAVPQASERGGVSVQIQGASLESYLSHVEIREDLTYTAVPQEQMARQLVEHMQSDPHADLGLTFDIGDHEATPRDRTYKRSEAASYGQRLEELAAVDQGFEWMIRCYHVGQERRRELVTAVQLGTGGADTVWTRPGTIASWRITSDASRAATTWQTRGDTVEEDMGKDSENLMSEIYKADALLAAGWPRLDATVDYRSVIVKDTLEDYAKWWRANRSGVLRTPEYTILLPDGPTRFNPNLLGAYGRFTMVDEWFEMVDGRPSYSERVRIVGCEVRPVSRETGREEIRLLTAEDLAVAA